MDFEAFDPDGQKPKEPERVQVASAPVVAPTPQEVKVSLDVSGASVGATVAQKRAVVGSGKARRVDELGAFSEGG